mgnify:CR=1 FL=1
MGRRIRGTIILFYRKEEGREGGREGGRERGRDVVREQRRLSKVLGTEEKRGKAERDDFSSSELESE